jgi:hypothetical protein
MPAGRPSKFTPEVTEPLLELIREGNFLSTAAPAAGVSRRTVHGWLRKGRAGETDEFADFFRDYQKAAREAEIKMLRVIMTAAAEDPDHARWYLERKRPDLWSRAGKEVRELQKQIEAIERKLLGKE